MGSHEQLSMLGEVYVQPSLYGGEVISLAEVEASAKQADLSVEPEDVLRGAARQLPAVLAFPRSKVNGQWETYIPAYLPPPGR